MLWVDKHRPKDLSSLDYHLDQASDLKHLAKAGDFPHLLVYGPLGAGKMTRIMCFLREVYGPSVDRLKIETMHSTTPSGKKLEFSVCSSNHHIALNPSDVGVHDRSIIMDVIKTVAQTQQLTSSAQRDFKVVLLTDGDTLSQEAQHALRRTMEKYIGNCRIILCCTSTSRIIPAVRSRCLCIRVSAPSDEVITTVLKSVATKESINLSTELAQKIALNSNRNLRRALLTLEACKVKNKELPANMAVPEPDWVVFIRAIAGKIAGQQSIESLAAIRGDFYELITFGIPSEMIFSTLLEELMKKSDMDVGAKMVEYATHYQHRMVQGDKEIFHLEAFAAKCMCLFQNLFQDLLMDDF